MQISQMVQLQNVNWVDLIIAVLIGMSVLMGIWRGFVREAMSLITWISAIAVGVIYTVPVSEHFTRISMVGLRYLLAFVLLVLSVLILGGIFSHLIARLISFTGFGVTDRIIGTLFGLARGAVVVAVAIMITAPTPFSKDPLWMQSHLIPRFEPLSEWIQARIPEDMIKKLQITQDAAARSKQLAGY